MRRAPLLLLALVTAALVAAPVLPARSANPESPHTPSESLPTVSSGHLPGPDVLYAAPPRAPQLENRHPAFRAAPILIAGSERYVDGEYLYQDYLNDDRGADVDGDGDGAQSAAVGDLVYPTDAARYAENGADIVELRIASHGDDVVVRFTLNTLSVADAAILSLVLDLDANPATGMVALPRDPGASFPGADLVVTTWGAGAEVTDHRGGVTRTRAVPVSADLEAAQLTVTIPKQDFPLEGSARYVVIAGVHDRASGGWARPVPTATATAPGGTEGKTVPAIFNVGPRTQEPVRKRGTPSDEAQAFALATGAAQAFFHPLDLGGIESRKTINLAPTAGTMLRIFPSRLELGGGRAATFPQFRQQLTEYSLRVPPPSPAGSAFGLTFYLHALNEFHWTNNANPYLMWVGDERNNLVATPLNRGPDGFYIGPAEFDTFEVWNDLARHYRIDPDFVSIMGTSMGGYGTYRIGSLYPDLFARAVTNAGPSGANIWAPPLPPDKGLATLSNLWIENTRNLPYLNQVATTDELVPFTGSRAQNLGAPELGIRGFDQLGHQFRFRIYHPADHVILSISSDRAVPAFLGRSLVDRDPRRVTFRYVPAADHRSLGLVHDHAYWVSDVAMRPDAGRAPAGPVAETDAVRSAFVDATSHAKGLGEPTTSPTVDAGIADTVPLKLSFQEVGRAWSPAPRVAPRNALDLRVLGVAAVTLDAARASLDGNSRMSIAVDADGPTTIRLTSVDPRATVTGARRASDDAPLSFIVAAGRTDVFIDPPEAGPPGGRPTAPGTLGAGGRSGSLPATGRNDADAVFVFFALAIGVLALARRGLRPDDGTVALCPAAGRLDVSGGIRALAETQQRA